MKLKVALIAPPYPLEEAPSPPLGICYVASAFIKAGASVKIYDFIVSEYSKEKLSEELLDFAPDIVLLDYFLGDEEAPQIISLGLFFTAISLTSS